MESDNYFSRFYYLVIPVIGQLHNQYGNNSSAKSDSMELNRHKLINSIMILQ